MTRVKLCYHTEEKKFYAMKILKKGFSTNEIKGFMNEVEVMSKLAEKTTQVPRIIDCSCKGECQKAGSPPFKICYYVMDVAENGELFGLIKSPTAMSEDLIRTLFGRILACSCRSPSHRLGPPGERIPPRHQD